MNKKNNDSVVKKIKVKITELKKMQASWETSLINKTRIFKDVLCQ